MPALFQGLGMFDITIEQLGKMIFFLWQHWRTPEVIGQMLKHAKAVFQVYVGLEGNISTATLNNCPRYLLRIGYMIYGVCAHTSVSR